MGIKINPLAGIELDEKIIRFGMTKDDLVTVLGRPFGYYETGQQGASRVTQLFYYGNALRFDFNAAGRLVFIEFLSGYGGSLQPEIYGVSAFAVQADELLDILRQRNHGAVVDREHGYGYAFPNIGIGIYRESMPEDIAEMEQEAKEEGTVLREEEYQTALQKAIHWATIGLGEKDYYAAG